MFVVPEITEWVPIDPPVKGLRNGDSILIHPDGSVTVKRAYWWRRLWRRFAIWTIFGVLLVASGCNEGQETADCGKQGILAVRGHIVECNDGKVFKL